MFWEQLDGRLLPLVQTPRDTLVVTLVEFVCAFCILGAIAILPRALFYAGFIIRNLWRNKIRTALTGFATIVLVLVVTLVWTVLVFLANVTSEKANNLKAIVTERWQIPSQMPYSYAARLTEGAPREPGDVRLDSQRDSMTWAFFGATLDPQNRTRENSLFFFAMEPDRFLTMMDGIDEMKPEDIDLIRAGIAEMEKDFTKVIIGTEKLKAMNKRVGESIKVTGLNYQGID